MIFNFIPHICLGNVQFSMMREDVRKLFGQPLREYRKTPFSKNTIDNYGEFHIYYDQEDKVEGVEVFDGDNEVMFHGVNLLSQDFRDSVNLLSSAEGELNVEDDGLVSTNLGLALYAPGHKVEPRKKAESILFFRDGYFE